MSLLGAGRSSGSSGGSSGSSKVHALRARAAARAAYDDSAAGAFTETWASAAAWTQPATPGMQVSGNKIYSTGTAGGGSGANKSYAIGTGNLYAVFLVNHVAAAVSGGVIVGVSKDTAGAIPTAGGGGAFGLYFRATNSVPQSIDSGAFSDLTSEPVTTTGTYVVTLAVDALYISVVAYHTGTGAIIRTRRLRAGFAVNNLYVFNSHTNALTGSSVGQVSGRQALASLPANEVNHRIIYSGDGTNNWMLHLPPGFDSRRPTPLCIAFHGNASNEETWDSNANMKAVKDAMVNAGYAFLTANYGANSSTWGAQASLDAYTAAYNYARTIVPIDVVMVYANSMGGIESELCVAERRIDGIVAWVGSSPTANLADNYANATFTALIDTAYGISGGNYSTKTAGHDPVLLAPSKFRGIPMYFLAAADDTVVAKATNTDKLASMLASTNAVTVETGITGGHSFDITPYTAKIVAFFDAAQVS